MYTLSDKASAIEMFTDVHKEIYSTLHCRKPHKGEAWRAKRSLTDSWVAAPAPPLESCSSAQVKGHLDQRSLVKIYCH